MIFSRQSIPKALGSLLVLGMMAGGVLSCSDPLTVDTPRKTVIDSVKKDTVIGVPGMVVPRTVLYAVNEDRKIWSSGQFVDTAIIIDTTSNPPRIYLGEQRFERPPLLVSWLKTVRVRADTIAVDGVIVNLRNDLSDVSNGMQTISTRFGPTRDDTLRSGGYKITSRLYFDIDRSRRIVTGHFQLYAFDYYFNHEDYSVDVILTINY